MPGLKSTIAHSEVISLLATPEQLKEFITTPERILDYYPGGIDGGVIEPGQSFYCRGKSGVSLLEILKEESSDSKVVVKVSTASRIEPPYTKERIDAAKFFSMIEDWELEATAEGSRLTKTWRDIKKFKNRFLPMGFIVKHSAKGESKTLKAAWDKAARQS